MSDDDRRVRSRFWRDTLPNPPYGARILELERDLISLNARTTRNDGSELVLRLKQISRPCGQEIDSRHLKNPEFSTAADLRHEGLHHVLARF
jgi:hypothetical protein